jgi:single-strand DNA-binding protein
MNLNFNKAILLGRISGDIIHKEVVGNNVTVLFLATNRKWKDKNGIRKEQSTFHKVICFGAIADTMHNLAKRGEVLLVEGRIQHKDIYDDNNNLLKKDIVIVCEKFQLGSETFHTRDSIVEKTEVKEKEEIDIDWDSFDI